jgi:predicted esterase
MKKIIPTFLLLLQTIGSVHAQNTLSCNGNRYINDIAQDATNMTVQYGSNRNSANEVQDLSMSIWQPINDTLNRRPVVIFAFGGGFISGNRFAMTSNAIAFAKKGYVGVTIDYRLWNTQWGTANEGSIVPIAIQAMGDMKAAIRFLYKSAKEGNPYKIDTNNIIIGGFSSGAVAAMLVAHMDSTDNIPSTLRTIIKNQGGFEGTSGNAGYSSKIKAAINMSGALLNAEWIDAGDPPFSSYHGTADKLVPYDVGNGNYGIYVEGSAACNRQAQKVGVPSYLYSVQGGLHSEIYTGTYTADFNNFLNETYKFLKKIICDAPTANVEINEKRLKIYPNPSFEAINLDFSENTEGWYQIKIYDLLGRQVFDSGHQNTSIFTLKKESIGKGMFITKVEFLKVQQFVTRKITIE